MTRSFGYITVKDILDELRKDGLKISRKTFSNLEKEGLFISRRTVGKWRIYDENEAKIIIHLIKTNYGKDKL